MSLWRFSESFGSEFRSLPSFNATIRCGWRFPQSQQRFNGNNPVIRMPKNHMAIYGHKMLESNNFPSPKRMDAHGPRLPPCTNLTAPWGISVDRGFEKNPQKPRVDVSIDGNLDQVPNIEPTKNIIKNIYLFSPKHKYLQQILDIS